MTLKSTPAVFVLAAFGLCAMQNAGTAETRQLTSTNGHGFIVSSITSEMTVEPAAPGAAADSSAPGAKAAADRSADSLDVSRMAAPPQSRLGRWLSAIVDMGAKSSSR